ncbi:M56 family metallopeptidase [Paenibacillus agricola]|uniref:M56 family metallopeptidase n=1 Tax=Paenibacillus agricola TaxID=2716264 RepID=A0ABX0J2K9_9BACL|nr:M56 family metallopeptidase [Paenibacillus agricola]NHN28224.1 M56 family metallopeptidase [Paenibacillus agricola]
MGRLLKPSFAIWFIYVVAAWIVLQMCLALSHQLGDVDLQSDMLLLIKIVLLDLLTGHSFFETLFVLLIALTCFRMFAYLGRQIFVSQNWNRYVQNRIHPQLTKRWTRKYKMWHISIDVIRERQPVALASGLLYPRIVVSTGLLEILSAEEVHAVLLHERYHCLQRDPLKKWLVRMIIKGMPYVSALKGLGQYYEIWMELLADRYAITQTNSTFPIGTALLKLVQTPKFDTSYQGVGFSESAINYRLSQLINPDEPVHVPAVSVLSACSSCVVLIIISLVILFQCI